MFVSLGIQRLAIDYQGRIQLFSSIFPLLELCLLCIYPCFKNISKALNEKLAHSAVLPVRRDITIGDKNQARLFLHGSETICSSPGLTRKC